MSKEDRSRWDERYRVGDWLDIDEPATILTLAEAWLQPPGLALDAACGSGRNALHLARRGYTVIAVDISWEGLQRLARRARAEDLPIHIVHGDLERFQLKPDCFDLVLNTRFLLRRLFDVYRRALKPGGLLLFETLTVDEIDVLGGDIRREFALERGELKAAFSDFEILLYEEGVLEEPEGERGMARLIGKRRASRPSRRSHQRL
ncbi:MAG: class I SAM-dependent methyltransferase [Gemmatimonadetes bacterium]|uniref:Class I SAM-dependent methyltransferase n=1 Tax=Candidatus Kutchimonas denitrificans TaxID=3056748 RepID=A0AAE4Z8R6_9BACT|nr:class I SAM-dependent methyltransferase [Gemmatimonadota bacterium]NIR75909.1 class I SAM-dependent methyltransferase [Candidatus Kutchimonas denitrificans]NIS02070.1 class I SAM-dependent methyltransferase [Gemmatimonadota bacterium]NIT67876.1 class I SAM-dependent methyltransferase [Gemmatimonadota bacterium]NIU53855.1 methyltransferase domain-containing protein [Gemmatimonadota bacterium]